MKKNKLHFVTVSAITAALYVVLTVASAVFGLSGGAVQVRLSESLTVLPVLFPEAVPGLFIGCLLSNILTGCNIVDIIAGSLTTLVAGILTYYAGKKHYILGVLPPIILNAVTVSLVLKYSYHLDNGFLFFFFSVFAGEFISAGIMGILLYKTLKKTNITDYRKKF